MKTLAKTLVASILAFASLQAFAFVPPYHISGTPILGTATFKTSGACKMPSEKFVNAQYGSIQDSANANVGLGVISADGTAILAVLNSAYTPGYSKYYVNQNPPGKIDMKVMYSFINTDVMQYIAAEAGCTPMTIWTNPTSYLQQKVNAYPVVSGAKLDFNIKQSFVGYVAQDPVLCPTVNNVLKCKPMKFTGGMSFKGQYIYP